MYSRSPHVMDDIPYSRSTAAVLSSPSPICAHRKTRCRVRHTPENSGGTWMPLTRCSKEKLHPTCRRLRAELPHGACRPTQLLLHLFDLASQRRCVCVCAHRGGLCNPIIVNRKWQNWISDGTFFSPSLGGDVLETIQSCLIWDILYICWIINKANRMKDNFRNSLLPEDGFAKLLALWIIFF